MQNFANMRFQEYHIEILSSHAVASVVVRICSPSKEILLVRTPNFDVVQSLSASRDLPGIVPVPTE